MVKVQRKAVPKGKKKKWMKIISPKSFNNTELGESYVYEPSQLLGKNIKVNMMTLTRDPKQQNINLDFKVNKLDGDRGIAEIKGFQMVPAFLKRIVRRGKSRVDMSFSCRTKDKVIRVKPLLLTRSLTHKPVLTALRKEAQKIIVKTFAGYTYENLIQDLLGYRIQLKIRKQLSKIYPLKSIDIRMICEEKVKKAKKVADIPVEEPVEKTEETKEEETVEEAEETKEKETVEETEEAQEEETVEEAEETKEKEAVEETEEAQEEETVEEAEETKEKETVEETEEAQEEETVEKTEETAKKTEKKNA